MIWTILDLRTKPPVVEHAPDDLHKWVQHSYPSLTHMWELMVHTERLIVLNYIGNSVVPHGLYICVREDLLE